MGRTYDQEYAEFATGAMRDLRRMAYLMCRDWHRMRSHCGRLLGPKMTGDQPAVAA